MESMRNRVGSRRLRGLVLHHRRHPSAHPRRLVTRTANWGDPPVRGICRWCHEHTATIHLTWHDYCLTAYRVASGQKPLGTQVTICEGCGGPAAELDHRLAINVARAMGPEALRRAVTLEKPALALQPVSPPQDEAGPQAGAVPIGLPARLARSPVGLETQPCLGGRVPRSSQDS